MAIEKKERNALIVEEYKKGKSLRAIAKMFNISHERVRNILAFSLSTGTAGTIDSKVEKV